MLDDLRRALRMDSPAPRLSESNLRKLSRGLRSSKKSRLSVHSTLDTNSVQDGNLGNRSVSLSTLLPSGGGTPVPRVDKLQSLEAKMANIEVSLGWRRRREALLETLPRAARDLVRELDSLHQSVREKDSNIQILKTQITNLGGTVSGNPEGIAVIVSETEKKTIQERLDKVQAEIEAKKVAVKNLKLTLDKIDVTDNIDVRIRAAEMEYELEREELNILNLKEESSVLTTRLQESNTSPTVGTTNGLNKSRLSFQELLTSSSSSVIFSGATLIITEISYTPGNPPFHVTFRTPYGCVIDWATDDTRLKKGDRIVELNDEFVFGKQIDEVTKLMSGSSRLFLVVARPIEPTNGIKKTEKQFEEKVKENKELVGKFDKALKERDSIKNDNTRLSHRISYLEDQVSELQTTLQKAKDAALVNGSPNEVLTPSQPGATIIQVFQKGEQTLAVAGPETAQTDRVQEYPTLPRLKSPSTSSTCSESTTKAEDKEKRVQEGSSVQEKNSQEPNKGVVSPVLRQRHTERNPRYRHSDIVIPPTNKQNFNDSRSVRTPCSMDESSDYSDYQLLNSVRRLVRPKNEEYSDYDSIEKLHNQIAEKSPSYSYKSKDNSFVIDAADHYADSTELLYQRPKRTSYDSDKIYGNPKKKNNLDLEHRSAPDGRSMAHSRPSSREDCIESSERGDSRQSRNSFVYERPPRRVLSPGAEVRNEENRTNRPRPIPPKKPERLSLQRTTSMLSVDDIRSCSRTSSISNTSKSHPNINRHQFHPENDFNREEVNSSYAEDRSPRTRDEYSRRPNSRISSISEEHYPSPSPRNVTYRSRKTTPKEHRRLTVASADGIPIFESPMAVSSPIRHNNGCFQPSKSPDTSMHLDSSLGLDYHQDVRAKPLYEFSPKSTPPVNPKPATRKSLEREVFQAPRTPSTPPRGINLSMTNSSKEGEEWC